MRFRFAFISTPALVLTVIVLAGCGSSTSDSNSVASKTPAQILDAAKSAAAGAATVHVAGSILSQGEPISLDMELVGISGVGDNGGRGHLTLGGLGVKLIAIDKAVYVKGNDAFYTHFAGAKAAHLLRGKWLKGSAEHGPLAAFASLVDLSKVIDSTLQDHGPLSSAGTTTVNGQKAVGVTDRAKDGTLYVAATGVPYPLEIVKSGRGTSAGKLVFDRWNAPVTFSPPTASINVKQLQNAR
ncbi:MAG TPA: hypothetical protein VIH71_05365 [Solirubrobacteraceae bacterium]